MKIEEITLTDVQKRKWIETRSALLWRAPAFTYILFQMLNPQKGELAAVFTKDVPIAATDGASLILNPEKFFGFSLDERVFIVAHEILHCILNHCSLALGMMRMNAVKYVDGHTLPYDQQTMNAAMDYVINDILIHDNIGKFPTIGLHDPKIGTRDDGFMDVYRRLYDNSGGKGQGGGFDVLLPPGTSQGKDPATASQERSQVAWDTAVAAAIASARAQGKLSAGLERLLKEIVDPQVSWQDHLRATLARRLGGGGYDWRKPDRNLIVRDIYAPRRSGNGCGPVVVAIDTSGSIQQPELDVFSGELAGILDDARPERVFVLWIDSKLHKVDEVEESGEVGGLKPLGGGGTSFLPAFNWIFNQSFQPDALIYMTDGYGAFPAAAPSYPVIWCDVTGKDRHYPFGDVVHVNVK